MQAGERLLVSLVLRCRDLQRFYDGGSLALRGHGRIAREAMLLEVFAEIGEGSDD